MDALNNGSFVYALSTSQALERYRNTSSKDVFLRDPRLRGFGVRISPGNTKSFFVEAREGSTSQVRRIVLGQFPVMPLKEARRKALEALRDLKYGEGTPSKEIELRTVVEGFLEAKAAHEHREDGPADQQDHAQGSKVDVPNPADFVSSSAELDDDEDWYICRYAEELDAYEDEDLNENVKLIREYAKSGKAAASKIRSGYPILDAMLELDMYVSREAYLRIYCKMHYGTKATEPLPAIDESIVPPHLRQPT